VIRAGEASGGPDPESVYPSPSVRTNPVCWRLPGPIIPLTPVARTQGTRLGPYEIVAPSSAGAGREVYHARDTRLDWTLAITISMVAQGEHLR